MNIDRYTGYSDGSKLWSSSTPPNSRALLQLRQDSALPNPFRFVVQKPLYSNTILTVNYRTYAWFPKKLVCTVVVFSDCHASVRQRNCSYLVVSVDAYIQLVKLFFRE